MILLLAPSLFFACTGGGDSTDPSTDSTAEMTDVEIGDPCAYLEDAVISALTGPYSTQSTEYPSGTAMCLWATTGADTNAEVGGAQLIVSTWDEYTSAALVASNYDMLAATSPLPDNAVHPASVSGAEDSFVLTYPGNASEPRAAFTARALTSTVNLALTGYVKESETTPVVELVTGLLQGAVDQSP